MKKYTLHLSPVNGGEFHCLPARTVELDADRILANDVLLPNESHVHGMHLYVIGHEFGAVCAVWASHEQDALDEMIDSNLGDCFLISEEDQASADEDEREDWEHLGNAGEACDLCNAWIQTVGLEGPRDWEILCAFAEARGNGSTNLDA